MVADMFILCRQSDFFILWLFLFEIESFSNQLFVSNFYCLCSLENKSILVALVDCFPVFPMNVINAVRQQFER